MFVIYDSHPLVVPQNISWSFTNALDFTSKVQPSYHCLISTDYTTLQINNVQVSDEGYYTLMASNLAGSASATISVCLLGKDY